MKTVTGTGWCGVWEDGTLGFCLSQFVEKGHTLNRYQQECLGLAVVKPEGWRASDMYRVKITVEPLKDKRGRAIVRKTARPKGTP